MNQFPELMLPDVFYFFHLGTASVNLSVHGVVLSKITDLFSIFAVPVPPTFCPCL